MISGCTSTTVRACPPAIQPSAAAIDGYAACPANPAFDAWMDQINRQQCRLADRKDCGK